MLNNQKYHFFFFFWLGASENRGRGREMVKKGEYGANTVYTCM
jgi:hypothetical protein